MKKTLSKICLTAGLILSLGVLVSSCSKDTTKSPDPGPTDDGQNKYITTNVATPIRYTESEFIGGDEGVSIKVTQAESNNITFVCTPGADIGSYLIQVYPMASIYNSLLNAMNATGQESLTADMADTFLSSALQEGTATGKLINKEVAGENFASYELNYMESALQTLEIQPDIDYLIVVLASFDDNVTNKNFGKLAVCHVCTPKKQLEGSPTIDMRVDIASSSTEYRVTHIPSEDCHFYYYLCTEASQIQQYIDVYGEEMYRKLLCHYGGKRSTEDLEALTFVAKDGVPGGKYTTTALALDANGTPSPRVFRKDFTLPEIPKDAEVAKCTFDFPDKIGASIIRNTAHLEKTCKSAHYRIYTKAEADAIMKADEKTQKAEAASIAKEGWSIGNKNFAFDRDSNLATGSGFDKVEYNPDLTGDTEYVMLYTGKNYYNQLSPIQATASFRTKKLVRDQPNASLADISISSPKTTRTGVTMAFDYTEENTAIYYFQYYGYIPGEVFPTPEDSSDEARLKDKTGWLYWLIDARVGPLLSPWPNVWYHTPGEPETFQYTWNGFDPKMKYNFCYVGEDWNGVLGPVKFFSATTLEAVGGPNPKIELAATAGDNNYFAVTYKANADTREFRYLSCSITGTGATALALQDLKKKSPDITYDDYISSWKEYTMAQGLPCYEFETSLAVLMEGGFMVSMAMSIGDGTDGKPVYSPLATLVFHDGKIETLEQYLGVSGKQSSSVIPSLRSDYQSRPERIVRDSRTPSWKLQD